MDNYPAGWFCYCLYLPRLASHVFCTALCVALCACGLTAASSQQLNFSKASLSQIEDRLAQIDQSLCQLAEYNLRSGSGSIGFRSGYITEQRHNEWIEIELEAASRIDQVVIVPSIWRDVETHFQADGFPDTFKLIARNGSAETVIATFGPQDDLLPRLAPVVVSFPPLEVTHLRFEATVTPSRHIDGFYNFELAEIMAFSGQKNIALHRPVTASLIAVAEFGPRQAEYLVDGFVPYLMDAASGQGSIATITNLDIDEPGTFTFDLGDVFTLDRLHLHAVDQSDTVPHSYDGEVGMPRYLLIEGAEKADFSDSKVILKQHFDTIYDSGPILIRNIRPTKCRYVRFIAVIPYLYQEREVAVSRYGFSEIELFEGDINVALNKPVKANFSLTNPMRSNANLNDGKNYYGDILPIRDWMSQLAMRHELESERPLIVAELARRYEIQKTRLKWMVRLTVLLTVMIGFVILLARVTSIRKIASLKERFAADLHDELGANLHTIGILSDLAEDSKDQPEALARLHERIRNVTEQTGKAVRHCTNLLQAKQFDSTLPLEMNRCSQRILAKLDHSLTVEGDAYFSRIKKAKQLDLLLFYKECLVNISRHSKATAFKTVLSVDQKVLRLCVSDNGTGFNQIYKDAPTSLQRRAHILGANLTVNNQPEGGTRIELVLTTRAWNSFLQKKK